MAKDKTPMTPALRTLKTSGVSFQVHQYRYEDHGGTTLAARALELDEHAVLKTLVMEDDQGAPLLVLMHGDHEVSTRALARAVGARSINPCDPARAQKHTGYLVGGISPFGTRREMPVYVEESVHDLELVYVNAGKRGALVEIRAEDLIRLLAARPVKVAI